jgi:hypothetical protein
MNWNKEEIQFLKTLSNPDKIQTFLDSLDYHPGYECRSPRRVMKNRSAHCFEGALFAAATLQFIGYKPLIVDMRAVNDDDHVIAVFKENGHWGAVAKSNFTSLRSYSLPFDLTKFESRNWATTDEDLEYIGTKIESLYHFPVVTKKMISKLHNASESLLKAGLLGSKPEGLFKPGKKQ